MYTKEDLKACLARMGLKGTDTVLMHSSMKSIGEVENRADEIGRGTRLNSSHNA